MDVLELREKWYAEARTIKSREALEEFARHILWDFEHGYESCVYAVSAIALAGAWLGSDALGITGFQASLVMWEFIKNWMKTNNKCGMCLMDFDDMLYPQYMDKFEKTITKGTWERLQEQARKNLEKESAHQAVIAHWESIVNGIVPFGYKVTDKD